MNSWIEQIVQAHSEFESPLNFWRWSALACISAIVKDNVYIKQYMFDTHPNIYVMLHADSGMKKGPPVNLAKKLVSMVNNTKVYSGRASIQGILKDLGQANSAPGGKIVKHTSAFICSSEFSSSLVEDKVATTILTDLYDRNYNADSWKSLLKMESFQLIAPTITMLTATNEGHSADFFTRKDWIGGYFARTFVIHEKIENRINSLLVPPENEIDYQAFSLYLRKLALLKGGFRPLASKTESDIHNRPIKDRYSDKIAYFSDAGLIYEEWYHEFKHLARDAIDPTGTLNRFGTSVLKVAMLLSLSESDELIISSNAMNTAIEYCQQLLGNIRQVTVGKTGSEGSDSQRKTLLLNELLARDNHSISMVQLIRKYWIQGNAEQWAEACNSFVVAEMISLESIGNQVIIKMKSDYARDIQKHMEGRIK